MKIPKETQFKLHLLGIFDGDWSYVEFKNPKKTGDDAIDLKGGISLSKDVGGLTLVATWVRTDSFIDRRDEDESVIEDED